jgi:probable F420-dependent oxidoreductase
VKRARFGVRLPVAGVLSNVDSITQVALEAERMGFDTAWVHDYLIWNKTLDRVHISCGSVEAVEAAGEDYPPIFFESLSNLAYLAGITKTIRIGVAVLCLPYREPLMTAKQIATIDQLSRGRLELGIGQGSAKSTLNEDFEVLGIDRNYKIGRTRETFEIMRRVWTEHAPTFEGRHFKYPLPATIYPKPVQKPHPPIWIGGAAKASLDMVADFADGWLWGFVSPAQFPKAIADIDDRLRANGRDPAKFTYGTEIEVSLARTTEEARRRAKRTMDVFDVGYRGVTGRFSEQGTSADTVSEIWQASLIGSPEDLTEEIAQYLDAGCTYFEMKFIYHTIEDLLEQMAMFSEEVAPAFREEIVV